MIICVKHDESVARQNCLFVSLRHWRRLPCNMLDSELPAMSFIAFFLLKQREMKAARKVGGLYAFTELIFHSTDFV